jgi:hypothetical protein
MQKLLILFLMTTGLFAHGNILKSQKVQLQCKEKAKEVAQSSYTYCLNEAREGELDKVKQDYKEKLDKLKNYYDKKIKALSGNDAESKKNINFRTYKYRSQS